MTEFRYEPNKARGHKKNLRWYLGKCGSVEQFILDDSISGGN
jgi:hypothetical protein